MEGDLADDVGGEGVELTRGEPRAGELSHAGSKGVPHGVDHGGDEFIEHESGLGHLAGDEYAVPCGLAVVEHAMKERGDEDGEALTRVGRKVAGEVGLVGGLGGVVEEGAVEAGLVAEVVVGGGDVGSGESCDLADGGVAEASTGEDLAGGVKEAKAGGVVVLSAAVLGACRLRRR